MKGFTLVELVVVLAVLSIISAVSIAAFVGFNRSQVVSVAIEDAKTFLYTARSYALAQANHPTECLSGQCKCPTGQAFVGYQVVFCCSHNGGQGCPNACIVNDASEHYELNLLCSSSSFTLESKHYPAGVSVSGSSTSRSFLFHAISGAVDGAGTFTVQNAFGQSKSLQVTSLGVVN